MCSIRSAFRLTILSLASYVFASDDPSLVPRLLPIHVAHYEQLTGVQRRSIDRLSDMEPQSSAPLYWGLPRHRDMMTLATMTLHALPGLPIVLLERFDHLTEHVDCNGDDGQMSLTFKSKPDFERASNAWSYINEHEDHRFLAIANHDGCAPEDERQPYIITNVREDPKMLTTYLTSHPIALHEVAHTFDLDWGHFKPHELRRQRRDQPADLMNGIQTGVNGIKNGWNGAVDTLRNTYIVPWRICNAAKDPTCLNRFIQYSNKDHPEKFSLKTGPGTQFLRDLENLAKLKCDGCGVDGTAVATGNMRAEKGKVTAGTLTVQLGRLNAKFPVVFEKTGKNNLEKQRLEIPLIHFPIPFAGFQIPNVFHLGAEAVLKLIGQLDAHGEGAAGATFEGSLSEHTVTFDFVQDNHVDQGGQLTFKPPKWKVRKTKFSTLIIVNFELSLEFGIDVGPDGTWAKFAARVKVPLPNWFYKIHVLDYAGGACKDDPTSSGPSPGLGVKIEGGYDVTITAELNVKLPGGEKEFPVLNGDLAKPVSNVIAGNCLALDTEDTPRSKELKNPDSTNPNPENENEKNSDSGTGESVADANPDNPTPKPYSISDDVLGLGSNPDPGNYKFAENQNNDGVQLPANLGASPDVASGQVAPTAYGLSNDNLGIASNDQQPSDPQKVQLANALIDPQTPSSGSNVATSSGSPFELGSLPSNTGSDSSSSDPNYLAFIPGQDTNQYTASLQGGGNSINPVASGGSSNTDQASANVGTDTVFGTDNKFGAYSPSNALLSTGSTTNSPSGIANTAQLSTDNNDALLSSTLGVDSNLSPAVTKRTLMGRAANRVRSFW